ncbi:MAG: hypothetical protein HY841_09210 [Bacteroidetes bacterium]|nr:hypothetical protein [Bacteroidota bacterium]
MANELDKFLHSFDEQEKNKLQANQQLWHTQKEFIAAFKKSLHEIIHPAMIKILGTLRKRGTLAVDLKHRRKQSTDMSHIEGFDVPPALDDKTQMLYKDYENYYLSAGEMAGGFCFILTVLGNYSLQKVCVFTEFIQHSHSSQIVDTSVKKTEERFDLAQITPELMDTIVTERIKQLIAIKQQADANKPAF